MFDNANGGHVFRNAMLALPEFTIHWLNHADSLVGRNYRYQREEDGVIEVPPGGRAAYALGALTAELALFLDCVRHGSRPLVDGETALEALLAADRVLGQIASHQWEGHPSGAIGPLVIGVPTPTVLNKAA